MTTADRLNHLLAQVAYLKYLFDVCVSDQLSQAIVLSAYNGYNGELINEPLYAFSCFASNFQDGVCDYPGNPLEINHRQHLDSLTNFRFVIAQTLRSRKGHPIVLTLIFVILLKTLSVPYRICVGIQEPSRKLSYHEQKDVLHAQQYAKRWRLVQLKWPTTWVEAYWHEIGGFVPVEFYSMRYCFGRTFFEVAPLRTIKLKPAEIRGHYIEMYRQRLLKRLSPMSSLKISFLSEDTSTSLSSSFKALIFNDSDDSSDSDRSDIEEPKNNSQSTIEPTLLAATGPIDHVLIRQFEDKSLQDSLLHKKPQKLSSAPKTSQSCIIDEVQCVLGIDNSGRIWNLTPRYFPKKLSLKRREYDKIATKLLEGLSQPIVTDATLWHLNQMDNKFLDLCRTNDCIPSSPEACAKHPLYAVKSKLSPFESLPENAKIAGYVKSEEVYFRKDVIISLPAKEWLKRGRAVPENTQWHHEAIISKKLTKDSNNRIKVSVPVFTFDQTTPVTEDMYRRNLEDEGRTTIVKGVTLPSGFVHLRESSLPGLVQAAIASKHDFKQAIVDFRFLSGSLRAVKDGIVVRTEFVGDILERQRNIKHNRIKKQNSENTAKAHNWWKVTFKMITALDHQ